MGSVHVGCRMAFLFMCIGCFSSMAGCQSVGKPDKVHTIFVAGDGSGDFNCAGTSDQLQINEALAFAAAHPEKNTVYLKGPHEYIINDTVFLDGNTTLTGDATAAIKLVDHANWPTNKPMVVTKSRGLQNITVCGFEINGNDDNNRDMDMSPREQRKRYEGHNWYNLLNFEYATNVTVHHMYLHNNLNDTCKASHCKNVSFHHNVIDKPGHDGLYCYVCENVVAHDNTFNNRTNCSIRFAETNRVKAYGNTIRKAYGGGAGIQVQCSNAGTVMDDVEVFNNVIHETRLAGMWIFAQGSHTKNQACGVRVHNNIFYLTGGAGINLNGFHGTLIENNVFDACNGTAISVGAPRQMEEGGATIIKNNIICNTRKGSGEVSGAGIACAAVAGQAVISSYNCFFNNPGGNMRGQAIESKDDIDKDPMFVNPAKHDYRLQAASPCIKAGENKVDIGAYGYPPMK